MLACAKGLLLLMVAVIGEQVRPWREEVDGGWGGVWWGRLDERPVGSRVDGRVESDWSDNTDR
jgi:hypothetical protein